MWRDGSSEVCRMPAFWIGKGIGGEVIKKIVGEREREGAATLISYPST